MGAGEAAKQAIESLKATPLLLGLLIINIAAFAGFGYILHEVSAAMARREAILVRCLDRGAGDGRDTSGDIIRALNEMSGRNRPRALGPERGGGSNSCR